MRKLFHVSDLGPFAALHPTPSPPGTEHTGRPLGGRSTRRTCRTTCWTGGDGHPLLGSPADRVIALEAGWLPALSGAGLTVHELATRSVEDCLQELAGRGVEVRLTTTLWPYVDAVVEQAREFSAIRMRNALPRRHPQPSGKVRPAEES